MSATQPKEAVPTDSVIIGNFEGWQDYNKVVAIGTAGKEYLRIESDGKVFIHGRFIGSDAEIIKHMAFITAHLASIFPGVIATELNKESERA